MSLQFFSILTVYPVKGFPAAGVAVELGADDEPEPVEVEVGPVLVVRVDEEDVVLRVELLLLLADPGL